MQMYASKHTEAGIRRRELIAQRQRQEAREEARRAQLRAYASIAEFGTTRTFQFNLRDRWKGVVIKSKFQRIEERACKVFGVSMAALKSVRRHRKISDARQFVMYWAMRTTSLSSTQIGRLMGGRDHTTVLHGKQTYAKRRADMGRYLRPAR
jgi:chromosomal replication initiation ATPase DnaA